MIRITLRSLIISFFCISIIWQFAEVQIHAQLSTLYYWIGGRPLYHQQSFDEKGIPIQIRPDRQKVYNPLFIARAAQKLGKNNEAVADHKKFIELTDWMLAHAEQDDETLVLYYQFDLPEYNLKAPWASALAQAVLMNVLWMRAEAEKDSLLYAKSRKVLNTLNPKLTNLALMNKEGGIWFEEYPSQPPSYVLNGMLSVLIELHEYSTVSGDSLASKLFDSGYTALLAKLPLFDRDGFSAYDLKSQAAGPLYHKKHVLQLKALNKIRSHPSLEYYQKRWRQHDLYPIPLQLILEPRIKRILAFLLAWFLLSDIIIAVVFIRRLREGINKA